MKFGNKLEIIFKFSTFFGKLLCSFCKCSNIIKCLQNFTHHPRPPTYILYFYNNTNTLRCQKLLLCCSNFPSTVHSLTYGLVINALNYYIVIQMITLRLFSNSVFVTVNVYGVMELILFFRKNLLIVFKAQATYRMSI